MKLVSRFFLALALASITSMAFAHHGSNGQFDHDIKLEITGIITEAKIVNPHSWVYLDVISENGETQDWRCEMHGAIRFRRQGWTEDMFAAGTPITIKGSQARREEFGCFLDSMTFADGLTVTRHEEIGPIPDAPVETVELAPGTPVMHGRWHAPPTPVPRGTYIPGPSETTALEAAWPSDIPKPVGENPGFVATELGIAAAAGFNDETNPRFQCKVVNFFQDWWFNQNVNTIDQSDDTIVLTYGFMGLVRTIHLDMDEHPDNILPSRAGHSIGRWEGETLVVDTIGFEEGYLSVGGRGNDTGVKHSNQMRSVERFDLSEDGEWLIMTFTVYDPLYLAQSYTAQLSQMKTTQPAVEYNCVDLTNERVEGF